MRFLPVCLLVLFASSFCIAETALPAKAPGHDGSQPNAQLQPAPPAVIPEPIPHVHPNSMSVRPVTVRVSPSPSVQDLGRKARTLLRKAVSEKDAEALAEFKETVKKLETGEHDPSQSNTISTQRNARHPVVADFNYQATQNGAIQFGSPGWEVSSESCPLQDAVNHEWLVLNSDGTVLSSVMVDDNQLFPVTANANYIWRTTLTPPAGCEPTFFGLSYNFSVIFEPAS